jgi:hypothetical protein
MARAPGMPVAHISALNPAGSLNVESGISLAGVAVSLPAIGASFDVACSVVRPCCHAGGGAATAGVTGATGAAAGGAKTVSGVDWHAAIASSEAANVILANINSPLFV